MFERTLRNLVQGIRAHKSDAGTYVSNEIQCIKGELKGNDPFVKAEAVRKLTYLNMMGYDINWAAFSIVEVMSMPRFGHKRIGYLAASQTFRVNTEVVLLTTNQLKKELSSPNDYEVGLAANCLANIATRDLSRDVLSDVVALLQHKRPYVRQKALLVLYKLFEQYPQALRLCFTKIRERLEDTDRDVVSCAVSVVCELADRNPKNYLALAPQLFSILTTSSNNWMLIKVVKLFGSLVEVEPRLARKLLEPLSIIIGRTTAKSLLYECIHTITLALPYTKKADGTDSRVVPSLVKLCSDHLRGFIEDEDQNLKYLGLVGLANLMNSHPRAVAEHYDLIIDCLEDNDTTICTRSLDLLAGLVTKRTLEGLVQRLLKHVSLAEGSYRQELISSIIFMCSRDKYAFLLDFKWYMGVLLDLSSLIGPELEDTLSDQLVDVALRVETVRSFAVGSMIDILLCRDVLLNKRIKERPLAAVAWIVGEYSNILGRILKKKQVLQDLSNGVWCALFRTFLSPEVSECGSHLQSTFVSSAFKLFVSACSPTSGASDNEISDMLSDLYVRLLYFCKSQYVEVSERANNMLQLLISYGILLEPDDAAAASQEPPLPVNDDDEKRHSSSLHVDNSVMEEKRDDSVTKVFSSQVANLLDGELLPVAHGILHDNNDNSGILSMSNNNDKDNEGSRKELGLSSVRLLPFDHQGVSAARGAEGHLRALISVPLNPVNPKAQSKVPLPEGVSLDDALKPELLAELLQDGDVSFSARDLSGVRFIQDEYQYEQQQQAGGGRRGSGVNASPMSSDGNPIDFEGIQDQVDTDGGYAEVNDSYAAPQKMDSSLNAFYLGSNKEDNVKMKEEEQIFHSSRDKRSGKRDELENDEDYAGGLMRSKKLHYKRTKRHSKKRQHRTNYSEAMPAGVDEVSGGEEPILRHSMHSRRAYGRRSKSDELSKIDITTPLEEDEKMPELKHREIVQNQQQLNHKVEKGNQNEGKHAQKMGKRNDRRAKRGHSSKIRLSKHSHREKSGSVQVPDLLDFSTFSVPEASAGHQMVDNTSSSKPLQADLSELLGKPGLDTAGGKYSLSPGHPLAVPVMTIAAARSNPLNRELRQPEPGAAAVLSLHQAPTKNPDYSSGQGGKERELLHSTSPTTKKKRSSRERKGGRKGSRKHSSSKKDVAMSEKHAQENLLQ